MSKREFTPGPWTAEPIRRDGHVWITARTDPEFNEFVLIAEVAPWNAPLIAAAPAMLAKLLELAGECANCQGAGCSECADITDVIAKATS